MKSKSRKLNVVVNDSTKFSDTAGIYQQFGCEHCFDMD